MAEIAWQEQMKISIGHHPFIDITATMTSTVVIHMSSSSRSAAVQIHEIAANLEITIKNRRVSDKTGDKTYSILYGIHSNGQNIVSSMILC